MVQEKINRPDLIALAVNGIGNYIQLHRVSKNYLQKELCDGICSIPTLSRIEQGEKIVDYRMIEAILDRMKIEKTEYEFVLDDNDYDAYKQREAVEILIWKKKYIEAEEALAAYEKKYGGQELHDQFVFFQKACLERAKPNPDQDRKREYYLNALRITAPNYKEIFLKSGILGNLELECIAEIIQCIKDPAEREAEYEKFYEYFHWNQKRDGFFPFTYRIVMQYYAKCLLENGKFEDCIRICSEVLEVFYNTSKVGNRAEIFLLRARARERKGVVTEEEKRLCLRDYLTAYTLISFYEGEERAETLKEHIREEYKWRFTD